PTIPGVLIVGATTPPAESSPKTWLEELGYFVALMDADRIFEALRARPYEVVFMAGELFDDPPVRPATNGDPPRPPREPLGLSLLDKLRRMGVAPIILGGRVDRFALAFARRCMGAIVRPNDPD